jgi:hypothetical protein
MAPRRIRRIRASLVTPRRECAAARQRICATATDAAGPSSNTSSNADAPDRTDAYSPVLGVKGSPVQIRPFRLVFRTPYGPTGNETRHDRSHLASAGRARPIQGEARPDASGPTPAPKITRARSTSAAAGSAHKRWAHQHERPSLTLPVQHLGRSSLPSIRHHGVTAAERAPQPVPPRRPRSIRTWAVTDSEHPGEGWQP